LDHQSITLLQDWIHPKRQDEVTNELVENLQQLTPKQSLHAITELKNQKTYILGKGGNQLDIPLVLQNPRNNQSISTNGLLDSGCTGSCIHEDFIRQHQILTENIPRPIPIYNADGMINTNGSVSQTAKLELTIGDHKETKVFGVTNLSKSKIFLGYEWLK
jgi:hypothetical protein